MEDGLSSILRDTADFDPFDTERVSDDYDPAVEEEKIITREIQEAFEYLENDFSGNEQFEESSSDDSDSSERDSDYSDEKSVLSNRSPSEHVAAQSSINEYEISAQTNEPDLVLNLNRPVIPPIDQYSAFTESDVTCSKDLDLKYLKKYNINELKNPDVHYLNELDVICFSHSSMNCAKGSNLNDLKISDVNRSQTEDVSNSAISDVNISNISASDESNRHLTQSIGNLQKSIEFKSDDFDNSDTFQTLINANSVKYKVGIHDQDDIGDVSSRITLSKFFALLEEYKLLQGLYNTKTEEMKQMHIESTRKIQNLEKDNKSFKFQLKHLEGEKYKFISQLQDTNDKFSVTSQENDDLKEQLKALETQFDQNWKARIDA